jgi:metal-responsive CopG/Arc/MetJ family transcriptional regulator
MSTRLKVTITMDESIIREIDRVSRKQKESRSRIMEEAMKEWKQKQIEKELIEGYRAMTQEDQEIAEANLEASAETLK